MFNSAQYSKIIRHLTKKKWEVIGHGAFGEVYSPPYPSKWVVKVGKRPLDGWPAYAKMCKENFQNNPYAPKIRGIWWNSNDGVYVALIERLYRTVSQLEGGRQKERSLARLVGQLVGGSKITEDIPQDLKTLSLAIRDELREKRGYAYDCHHGNFMIDYDGRFVVTDPVGARI